MNFFFKKTSIIISFALVVLASSQLYAPKKVDALFGAGDIVSDILVETNTSTIAASAGVSAQSESLLQLKSFSLDKVAVMIVKQILQQLTLSIISWINSGFNGSPSFIQNPTKFFEGVGDQIAGKFLSSVSPLAASLCSPFNISVRISLALEMSGGIKYPYTCTLSDMVKNTKNAVKGASINGFTAGDFRQGGWPAFLTLTTVPANNPNGAFLLAQSDLNAKIGQQVTLKQNFVLSANGFLSFEKCTDDPEDYSGQGTGQDCEVQTPGSAISATLNKSLGVPTDELELANDINAIINAAFSQLVLIALKSGLGAISGSNGTSNTAYVQQIQAEQSNNLQSVQASTINNIQPYLNNAQQVTQNAQVGLNIVLAAQTTLNKAQSCNNDLITKYSQPSYGVGNQTNALAVAHAQGQLDQINTIILTQVAPLVAQSTVKYNNASSSYQSLIDLANKFSDAQNATGLNDPSQQLQGLAASGNLPSTAAVTQSNTDLTTLRSTIDPIQSDANNRLYACQTFSPTANNGVN